jgi:putative two-component system response regulator
MESQWRGPNPYFDPMTPTVCSGTRLRTTGPLLEPKFRTAAEAGPARKSVLVVDDEPGVRMLLKDLLSDDYECECADGGRAAMARCDLTAFDIVLTDVMMPDGNGVELLNYLQEHHPGTAVVMLTAHQDTRAAIDAIRAGAFDYMLKPFDIDEVLLCLGRAVRYKDMLAENQFYQAKLESLVVDRTANLREETERLRSEVFELSLSFRSTLSVLTAAIESRDVNSPGHTERVVAYALRLGRQLGFDEAQLSALEHGALLHDVGMVQVPDHVLRKPGALTDEEREAMRMHPRHGAALVRQIGMLAVAAPVVEQHHERWDGAGYPRGLAGEEIDVKARVFAVADCIDAVTGGRAYAPARGFSKVADELLRCKGTQFDPAVVDAFFEVAVEEWEEIRTRDARPRAPFLNAEPAEARH